MVMPSISTNGSPSISMRSENVPESPSSALQTTYFCSAGVLEHRLPLDAGGKRRAAAAAQARLGDRLDDRRPAPCVERAPQPAIAAVRHVVVDARPDR